MFEPLLVAAPTFRIVVLRRWCSSGLVAAALVLPSTRVGAADAPPPSVPSPTIDAIVVTAQKLSVETKIDRKVYTVADDAQSAFGSASDMLNVIPSVDVGADGIVSLRGDANVLVLIDGKPSTLFQGSAAGENLQSLSAADIERIEVLTTPPPQFKAEGAAGVIWCEPPYHEAPTRQSEPVPRPRIHPESQCWQSEPSAADHRVSRSWIRIRPTCRELSIHGLLPPQQGQRD